MYRAVSIVLLQSILCHVILSIMHDVDPNLGQMFYESIHVPIRQKSAIVPVAMEMDGTVRMVQVSAI